MRILFRFAFFCILTGLLSLESVVAQDNLIHIIPEPAIVKINEGHFVLKSNVAIVNLSGNPDIQKSADLFVKQLSPSLGYSLKIAKSANRNEKSIYLALNKTYEQNLGTEGYALFVKQGAVSIRANKPAGIFNGLQSFVQLLPPELGSKTNIPAEQLTIPCMEIIDYPRFEWRGMMLDVSRHFFSKEFVKSYLDQMSHYKFNVFHWHLADNDGWRIEIKAYPKLTEIGAWRVPRTGIHYSFEAPEPNEKATDGGFYTQEDIKEIVEYARERNITIVPEIDLPGHSSALIAAYPEASCTGKQFTVYAGFKDLWGENVLCVGNENNFVMIDKIFSEVAGLFPGKYFHIGGDEVDKQYWKQCPKCQQRIKEEGLKNEEELQSYFIKRIEKILLSKGKTLVGWDEILEGGLAPSAVVMSWRGADGGIAAAKAGHEVVMDPDSYCYFNHIQGDFGIEKVYSGETSLRLSDVYKFEPVPKEVDPKYILGGQGNIWTEFIPNERWVEYQTWPRALAMSEVLWSPKEKRDWDGFVPRVEIQLARLRAEDINYAPSVYDPSIVPVKDKDGKMQITFTTEIKGLDVYYTFDNTFPDNHFPKYDQKPLSIPKGASDIWAITYRNGKPVGRFLLVKLEDLKAKMK